MFSVAITKIEIDNFMKVFKREDDKGNQTYNMHTMLHLHDDRLNHGPLCFMNAYAYENQLQSFKNMFKSRNIRLETLVRKVKQEKLLVNSKQVDASSAFVQTVLPATNIQKAIKAVSLSCHEKARFLPLF